MLATDLAQYLLKIMSNFIVNQITNPIIHTYALSICTHYIEKTKGNLCGESFLILINSRSNPIFTSLSISFDESGTPDYPFKVDASRVLSEAVQQGIIDYTNFIDSIPRPFGNWPSPPPQVTTIDKNEIFQLWLRGNARREILKIKEITQSDELKDFLNIVIQQTPIIIRRI